jgi:glycosyltransferase involved in cell wall biosynthesis
MKIAIVHDYIKEYGGAERVLEELIKIYPEAVVFTTLFLPEYLGPHRDRFEKYKIQTSFLQYVPFNGKLISPLRLLSPFAFKGFDFKDYDVILVSQTGAYFPNSVRKIKNQKLITYTHTPPRYLYGYKTARNLSKNKFIYLLTLFMNHFLRMVDFKSAQNVDQFIANSLEVKGRIEKFYRRDSIVIYPPVVLSPITNHQSPITRSYYLTGGRLARAKGIDVIVKAFNENGLPLKIFGKGFAGFEEELRKNAKGNIEFVGEISDEEKFELMAQAKAFVFASYDEDFGITPVESMGVGTPVIAYKSGGVKETVVEGESGLFYKKNTPDELNRAIKRFETLRRAQGDKLRKACQKQAEKFSAEEFDREIKEIVGA